jgi:hypothetical protein
MTNLDNDVLTEIISIKGHNKELTPYLVFKYILKEILVVKKIVYHNAKCI